MTFIEPSLIDPDSRETAPGDPIALAATRCMACDRVDFPSRGTCSRCGAETEATTLTSAQLGSRTAVLHAPPGALVEVPYHIGVGEFSEGVAVLGLLLDEADATRGGELEVVSVPVGERMTYAFRPVAARA